jgi:hypothetical protein
MRKLILPAATLAAALALAGPAAADTYCVHLSGTCPVGTTDAGPDLKAALLAAANSPVADTVTIGPGTFTAPAGGFDVTGPNPLTVVGSGPGTILDGATSPIVDLNGTSSPELSGVTVQVAPSNSYTGIAATGPATISDVVVTGTGATNRSAISASGAVAVAHVQIGMSGLGDIGVSVSDFNGATPTVRDSTIVSGSAVRANGHGSGLPFSVQRIVAVSQGLDIMASPAVVELDDSVIRHTGGSSPALVAQCPGSGGSSALHADHVTLVGDGSGAAIQASCLNPGQSAAVTVTNSTIRALGSLSFRTAGNGGTADIAVSWSDVPSGDVGDSGPGAVSLGAGVVTVADPGFVGVGDERLTAGSPLIDAGDPLPSPFAVDLGSLARVWHGRQDIGAHEFQGPIADAPKLPPWNGPEEFPPSEPVTVVEAPADALQPKPLPRPAQPTRAQLRAVLSAAIATGTRGTHTLRWVAPGRVTFEWRVRGHVVGLGIASRTTVGLQRVPVHITQQLPRNGRVVVHATFSPVLGPEVTINRRITR